MNDRVISPPAADESNKRNSLMWLRRLGLAGFLFFLCKGLLWLIIPVLIAKGFFGS